MARAGQNTNNGNEKDAADDEGEALVWFRHDLRLADNLALAYAANADRPLILLFILDEDSDGIRKLGGAQRWWLHHSLAALTAELEKLGTTLLLRCGPAKSVLDAVLKETSVRMVVWNRRYEPPGLAIDDMIAKDLESRGVQVKSFPGQLLHDPGKVRTGSGTPYKVYTPFWRALQDAAELHPPLPAPDRLVPSKIKGRTDILADWNLLPTQPDWSSDIAGEWSPGEAGAAARLEAFIDGAFEGYDEGRERPAQDATSRLSPHLAFGEITPAQIWAASNRRSREVASNDRTTFRKELVWREFSHHLLFHRPDLPRANYNERFDRFPWRTDKAAFRAWCHGRTGYPIVDAGMRQLWQTGWMHNRVRMIVASFLTKHLLIDWREGEAWFWDTLVDADTASNAANWQWVAGSGADAAPYFRIFNPVLQGEKFDADGAYVRAFVPELAHLDSKFIHKPWSAPAETLHEAGISLGKTYPRPIVDHTRARERALDAYKSIKDAA